MKILVAGDFCPQHRVEHLIDKGEHSVVFSEIKSFIENNSIDYSIVNFECPVVLADYNPIAKVGPNLKCISKAVDAIKYAGFDCVTLANNHILDYGVDGLSDTIKVCSDAGLDIVGVGDNLFDAHHILYKQIGEKKIAIINCCEHEFSIATETTAGANPLNPIQQYYDIKQAKSNADYVLVIVHGGHEGYQLPSVRMVDTYRFFIDAGADAVVNHHQHCFSGYEIYNGKPIFYGLGNFCFDISTKRNEKWNLGYMLVLDFDGIDIKFDYIPYNQCSDEPSVKIIDKKEVENDILTLNSIIGVREKLLNDNARFYLQTSNSLLIGLEPLKNRLYKVLRYRGIIKSPLSQRVLKYFYALANCESHRDRFLLILKNKSIN